MVKYLIFGFVLGIGISLGYQSLNWSFYEEPIVEQSVLDISESSDGKYKARIIRESSGIADDQYIVQINYEENPLPSPYMGNVLRSYKLPRKIFWEGYKLQVNLERGTIYQYRPIWPSLDDRLVETIDSPEVIVNLIFENIVEPEHNMANSDDAKSRAAD